MPPNTVKVEYFTKQSMFWFLQNLLLKLNEDVEIYECFFKMDSYVTQNEDWLLQGVLNRGSKEIVYTNLH